MFPNEIEGRSLISLLKNEIHIFKNITSESFGSTIISNTFSLSVNFVWPLLDCCLQQGPGISILFTCVYSWQQQDYKQ